VTATPATAAPKSASLWEDFVDIFYAPTQVFERRRAGQFGLALLILVILTGVAFAAVKPAIQPAIDAQVDKSIEQLRSRPGMTAEQMASVESKARKMGDVTSYLGAPIGVAINVLLTALGLWVVGKFFESKQSYSQAAMVATYANVPRVLGLLLGGVIAFFMSQERITSMFSVSLSAARFAPPGTSPVVVGLLSRIDPFTIWATVLLAIGLRVTGGVSKRAAYTVAVILFLLGSAFAVAAAARQMA
jgi:hypothetical protein